MSDKVRYLLLTLVAIGSVLFEVHGSHETGSWAILSDAFHMAADGASFCLGFAGILAIEERLNIQKIERTIRLWNSLVLFALGLLAGVGGLYRFLHPIDVEGYGMLWYALFSFASNGVQVLLSFGLKDAHHEHATFQSQLNHLVGDLYTSFAVAIGALGIIYLGHAWPDTIASLYCAWKISKMGMHTWHTIDNPHAGHHH